MKSHVPLTIHVKIDRPVVLTYLEIRHLYKYESIFKFKIKKEIIKKIGMVYIIQDKKNMNHDTILQ